MHTHKHIHKYLHTHTHTHIYIYTYIYTYHSLIAHHFFKREPSHGRDPPGATPQGNGVGQDGSLAPRSQPALSHSDPAAPVVTTTTTTTTTTAAAQSPSTTENSTLPKVAPTTVPITSTSSAAGSSCSSAQAPTHVANGFPGLELHHRKANALRLFCAMRDRLPPERRDDSQLESWAKYVAIETESACLDRAMELRDYYAGLSLALRHFQDTPLDEDLKNVLTGQHDFML